jgi:hypothetical protein
MAVIIKTIDATKKTELVKFFKSQLMFYKDDPNFVAPLYGDKLHSVNEKKAPFFEHGEMKHFMAYRDGGIVGRISALVNRNHNDFFKDKVGFIGNFECENDQEAADALFNAAAEWLKSKDMDTMRGPIYPDTNGDCGLLIDGFDLPPVVMMAYNPEFYQHLFDGAGFVKAKDLHAYDLQPEDWLSEKLERLQGIVRKRYKIEIEDIHLKDKEGFERAVNLIKEIYDTAWEANWGNVKLTEREWQAMVKELKMIADERLLFLAKINGEYAGFQVTLPDVNQALIYNKKGTLAGAIWHLLTKKKKINRVRIVLAGVLPKYRKSGADAVMYYEIGVRGRAIGYNRGEGSWILEDNIMPIRGLTQIVNGKLYKMYRIYDKAI